MLSTLLSILLPESCRSCSRPLGSQKGLCIECAQKITWVREPWCPTCALPYPETVPHSHPCPDCTLEPPAFDWHRSCVLYKDPVPHLIYRLKYGAGLEMVPLFADWILERHEVLLKECDLIIPVPLAMDRLRERTFNQSLEIAKTLGRRLNKEVPIHSLQKIKSTPSQTKLPRPERVKNLRGAFEWTDSLLALEGKRVVLMDDVFSTGSTLDACAQVLKKTRVAEVGALTLVFNQRTAS